MNVSRVFASATILTLLVPLQLFAASGSLRVSQTPALSGSVPKGAQRVAFLHLTLKASCDSAVTVESIVVVHRGLGDSVDLSRVYVHNGKRRLTRSRSFDSSDQTAQLRFVPALSLKACESRSLSIMADISADAAASGEHVLFVELPSDISTSATVRLDPLADSSTATVRPKQVGTVNVVFLDLLQPLRFGRDRTLSRFRIEVDGEANQDIHSITLTNDGKATDADLTNLSIRNRRGQVLTNVAPSLDGDRVNLTFDPPLRINRNDEILLELKGDIRASKRRTVRFILEEPSDLEAAPAAR